MMKKLLLSAIAVLAMTICSFAQMQVCSWFNTCSPHENEADYSTGIIPVYPVDIVFTVGVPVDECISLKIPSEISGSDISSMMSSMTISVNSLTINELVNLPDGLTACASANPMEANGTYTLHITGTPTIANEYPLNIRGEIDGESNSAFVSMSLLNNYFNGTNGLSTGIIITVVEAGALAANFTTTPEATGLLTQAINIYEGETVTYTNTSIDAHHIAWTFEGGAPATSTENNVTVTYATAGTYTSTLIAYNESSELTDTATASVVVSASPVVFNVDFQADNTTVLVGQTVNFTNNVTATQNGQPYTGEIFYSWSFDADGGTAGMLATSTDANPAYSYTAAGVYSVKLAVATSQYGVYMTADTLVKHAYITVVEDPNAVTADFTTNPEATTSLLTGTSVNIMVGESIVYTSACNENTTSIAWTFQGGAPATSTDNQVTVTYATAGTYTTTLTAYGANNEVNTKTLTVIVSESTVEASFYTDPAYTDLYIYQMLTIEAGTTVTYTSTSTNAHHIAWAFEGGAPSTSTENVVTVTYNTIGSYTTTLIAYNEDESSSDEFSLSVTVTTPAEDAVTADFTTDPEATNLGSYLTYISINQGGTVTFTNASTNAHHIAWTFEGGFPQSSTNNTVTVYFFNAGNYTATLTAYNEDETVSDSKTIYIMVSETLAANFSTNPAATGIFSSSVYINAGGTITYTNQSAATDHIAWSFEGGSPATSTENEVTVTYSTAGTYTTTLTAYNTDETISDSKTITVYVMAADFTTNPEATNLFITSYVSINQGETITFTDASINAHHIAWTFEGGAPSTSTENVVTVTYAESSETYFTATLTAYNEDETISDSKSVNVRVAYVDPDAVEASFTTDPAYTDL